MTRGEEVASDGQSTGAALLSQGYAVEANHCCKQVRHKNGLRNGCVRYPEGERNFDRRRPRFHFRGERTLK